MIGSLIVALFAVIANGILLWELRAGRKERAAWNAERSTLTAALLVAGDSPRAAAAAVAPAKPQGSAPVRTPRVQPEGM